MMTVVMPDLEALVVDFLTGHSLLSGVKVATEIPPTPPTQLVTITLIGSPRTNADAWLCSGLFQIACWHANNKSAASLLARRTRAALRDLQNFVTGVGTVNATTVTQGPTWQPDPSRTPPTPRYILTAEITAHP